MKTIKSTFFSNKQTEDLFLKVELSDNNEVYYFYAPAPDEGDAINLPNQLKNLSSLLEKVYNYGKSNIPIEFKENSFVTSVSNPEETENLIFKQ
jgi:hypothetical protein